MARAGAAPKRRCCRSSRPTFHSMDDALKPAWRAFSATCRIGASWRASCRGSCAARCFAARRSPRPSPPRSNWPRSGRIELRQDRAFGPIYLRSPARPRRWRSAASPDERARAAVAPGRGAACSLPPSRSARKLCAASRRSGRCRGAAARAGRELCRARRQPGPARRRLDVSHRARSCAPSCGSSAPSPASCRAPRSRRSRSIAYHQPVTRAEIEQIRGVALGKGTIDTLMEAGWVRPKGRRAGPGRPLLWVTTPGLSCAFRPRQPERAARGSTNCAPPGCSTSPRLRSARNGGLSWTPSRTPSE